MLISLPEMGVIMKKTSGKCMHGSREPPRMSTYLVGTTHNEHITVVKGAVCSIFLRYNHTFQERSCSDIEIKHHGGKINRLYRHEMSLASGHHRIMAAARGALVMMVFGKVEKIVLDHRSKSSSSI